MLIATDELPCMHVLTTAPFPTGKPTPKFSAAEEEAWAKLCKAYATPF